MPQLATTPNPGEPVSYRNALLGGRWLPTSAAAADIGRTPKTIRHYVDRGLVRAYRIGLRNLVVNMDDVRALLVPVGPPRVKAAPPEEPAADHPAQNSPEAA